MSVVPLRQLPDTDDILRAVLSPSGAPVSAGLPSDLLEALPHLVAVRIGGAAVHLALLDRATVMVDAYASTRRAAADLAETARVLLYRAWRSQDRVGGGTVARVTEVSSPSELRTDNQPAGLYRFNASYSLLLRP